MHRTQTRAGHANENQTRIKKTSLHICENQLKPAKISEIQRESMKVKENQRAATGICEA